MIQQIKTLASMYYWSAMQKLDPILRDPKPHTDLYFTSTTGRTGTHYLAEIIRLNAPNAVAEHDPFPRGYGEAIRRYDDGDDAWLRALCRTKLRRIASRTGGQKTAYLESSHGFAKSFAEAMRDLTPYRVIHLVRNGFKVAKSFLNRGSIPSPDNPYLLHPGLKRNLVDAPLSMTPYQKCLWYVYESEARHLALAEKLGWEVFDLPTLQLSEPESMKDLLRWMELPFREPLKLPAPTNTNPEKSIPTDREMAQGWKLYDLIDPKVLRR